MYYVYDQYSILFENFLRLLLICLFLYLTTKTLFTSNQAFQRANHFIEWWTDKKSKDLEHKKRMKQLERESISSISGFLRRPSRDNSKSSLFGGAQAPPGQSRRSSVDWCFWRSSCVFYVLAVIDWVSQILPVCWSFKLVDVDVLHDNTV